MGAKSAAKRLGVRLGRASHYLEELFDADYLRDSYYTSGNRTFSITKKGLRLLVEKKII